MINFIQRAAICAVLAAVAVGAHGEPIPKTPVMPPWAEASGAAPIDNWATIQAPKAMDSLLSDGYQSVGGGLPVGPTEIRPTAGVDILLASGTLSYVPAPDMVMQNPKGSDAVFQRSYRSDCAFAGYGSPGLPPGWVHNYDIRILTPPDATVWGPVALMYPTGAHETLTPTLDADGKPTGEFKPINLPYTATGVPGAEPGKWKAITLQWKDRGEWSFLPSKTRPGVYPLFELCGLVLSYDSDHRLQSVADVDDPKSSLLTWRYDDAGYLQTVTDVTGRSMDYQTKPIDGKPCLTEISSPYTATDPKDSRPRYTFLYKLLGDRRILTKLTTPSAADAGRAIVAFDYEEGRVVRFSDPIGNYHQYAYSDGRTRVDIKEPDGKLDLTWTQKWDSVGRNIGNIDALGHEDSIKY